MTDPSSKGRFRYGLQPLLDLREWQLDLLKADLSASEHLLAQRTSAMATQAATVAQCRQWLQDLRTEGARLDLDREGVLRRYLPQVEARLAQARDACEDARQQRDKVMLNLLRAHRAARGLQTHRDECQRSHVAAQEVWRSKEADDAWMLTHLGRRVST